MITFTKVTKEFHQKIAVHDLTFKAKPGEVIGFLGPNGAGKTTTMRMMLGYLQPTRGIISINNLDPIHDRVNLVKTIGYLPENNPLYPEMRVYEYLDFISRVKKAASYKDFIDEVGIEDAMSTKIEELSRGYRQRVGLAAALIGNPALVILDEPTSGLDPIEQEKIRILIKQLAKRKTIIFSTHILSEVEDVATRLIIIHKGELVYDGAKPKAKGSVEKLFKKLVKD